MVPYILALLPLAEDTRAEDLGVLHPWYAYNAAVRGTARPIAKLLHALMGNFSCHGYFLEP